MKFIAVQGIKSKICYVSHRTEKGTQELMGFPPDPVVCSDVEYTGLEERKKSEEGTHKHKGHTKQEKERVVHTVMVSV